MTIGEALEALERKLANLGAREPDVEARLILAHVLGAEPGEVLARRSDSVDGDALQQAERIAEGRRDGTPLPYLLGRCWFMDFELKIDARAMVPRAETETLVEAAIELAERTGARVIADIGTGSGCIAIALARAMPGARIVATDASREALSLAAENIFAMGLQRRILLLHGSLLEPLRACDMAGEIEAVVCNPPYVSEAEMAEAGPELSHEPREALVAGPTGLEVIQQVVEELPSLPELRFAALEVGYGQAAKVAELLQSTLPGWGVEITKDFAGSERGVAAVRPGD